MFVVVKESLQAASLLHYICLEYCFINIEHAARGNYRNTQIANSSLKLRSDLILSLFLTMFILVK